MPNIFEGILHILSTTTAYNPKKMHLNQKAEYFFSKPNLCEWAVGEFNDVDLGKSFRKGA
jgi:hypothetical protein